MTDVAIRVRNLVKDFEIYEKPADLALEILTRKKRHHTFRALDDVSFDVERGQVLGIIGPNGAGKSTLLKIITGVLDATSGSVEVSGRVTAILELGLGFNSEYTGRDNIYLSGMLYGMTRDEIDRKLETIIDFSGLREFMNQPVKTYSSGMHSRLAFSIATAVDPEILIIDEALAAGDAMFVQKSMRRIRQLCSGGRTVLLVSHGTGILAQLCRNAIWIDRGAIKMAGPSLAVVQAYDLAAHQGADVESWIEEVEDHSLQGPEEPVKSAAEAPVDLEALNPDPAQGTPPTTRPGSSVLLTNGERAPTAFDEGGDAASATGRNVFRRGPVLIDSVTMLNHESRPSTRLTTLRPFKLRIAYHCEEGPIPAETLGIALAVNRLSSLEPVLQWYTQFIRPDETRETFENAPFRVRPTRRGVVEVEFGYAPFQAGDYVLSLGLLPNAPGTWEFYEYRHFFYAFRVSDAALCVGAPIFFQPSSVKFEETISPLGDQELPVDDEESLLD